MPIVSSSALPAKTVMAIPMPQRPAMLPFSASLRLNWAPTGPMILEKRLKTSAPVTSDMQLMRKRRAGL
jgi:hypothetical protein